VLEPFIGFFCLRDGCITAKGDVGADNTVRLRNSLENGFSQLLRRKLALTQFIAGFMKRH
jgi:hypothetical protein